MQACISGEIPYTRVLVRRSMSSKDAPSEPLPEDTTPLMWQRVAQLVAGTVTTGSFLYFVLLADFGKGDREHCFTPVCYYDANSRFAVR